MRMKEKLVEANSYDPIPHRNISFTQRFIDRLNLIFAEYGTWFLHT